MCRPAGVVAADPWSPAGRGADSTASVDREGSLPAVVLFGSPSFGLEDMAAAMDVANPGAAAGTGLDSCPYMNSRSPSSVLSSGAASSLNLLRFR